MKPQMQPYEIEKLKQELTEHLIPVIQKAVKETVNGKIDKLTDTLDDHLIAIAPMMKQFEKFTIGKELAFATFKAVAWVGGVIIALSGAYYVVKNFLAVIVTSLIK